MSVVKVPGSNNKHKVKVFTISTCGWCKKMKRLLQSLEVEYEYVDLDTTTPEEDESVRSELRKHNPRMVTPTVVIDDGENVIIGYLEDKVRETFKES
jgi:glutaredoxin